MVMLVSVMSPPSLSVRMEAALRTIRKSITPILVPYPTHRTLLSYLRADVDIGGHDGLSGCCPVGWRVLKYRVSFVNKGNAILEVFRNIGCLERFGVLVRR